MFYCNVCGATTPESCKCWYNTPGPEPRYQMLKRARAKAPELLECLQTLLDEVAHGQPTVGAVAKGCALIAEIEGGEV